MREIFRGRGGRSRWRAAAAVVAGLALAGLGVGVAAVPASATPSWAGSTFCSSHDGGRYLNSSYNGVAACVGPLTGNVEYSSSVVFDTAGYNCVELAARYLYATTGINPPQVLSAYNIASEYASAAEKLHYNFPLSGWTSAYSTSIAPGDIISMQGTPGNPSGHVAIVTKVSVSGGKGTIQLLEENGASNGINYVNVNNGQMSYGLPSFDGGAYYYTSFRWVALDTAIPAEPTSLSASSVTGSSAVLHWTDSAKDVGQYLTQYKIGNGRWTSGPSAPAGATSVSVGGLRTGTTYTFQVGASNAKGTRWSAYLTVKTVPIPAEPAIGKPAMAARDATISWQEAASNQSRFLIQYKLGSGAWQAGPSVGSGSRSVTIGGLIPGESYTFQVGADNIAGTRWSAYATGSTPQVLASQVTNARVTATSETAAALAWTNTADNVASFATQYRVTGTGAWTAGSSVGAGTTSVTVGGLKAGTKYTFQVGARNSKGTNWGQYFYGTTASAPAPAPAPTGYNTGHEVTVVSQATGGDSGHKGPANSYAAGPTHAAGSPIYIVCYVNGQSIAGPYGTETAWDLGDDGYYYSDAWLWTDSNGPVVPACDLKTVTVVSQATGGDSGHSGPSNTYSAGPARAAGSDVQIACYVSGQSIAGPYGTESIWDLSTDGYYYSDSWLWTDSNGPAVPECP
jgi:hypothetical protein